MYGFNKQTQDNNNIINNKCISIPKWLKMKICWTHSRIVLIQSIQPTVEKEVWLLQNVMWWRLKMVLLLLLNETKWKQKDQWQLAICTCCGGLMPLHCLNYVSTHWLIEHMAWSGFAKGTNNNVRWKLKQQLQNGWNKHI